MKIFQAGLAAPGLRHGAAAGSSTSPAIKIVVEKMLKQVLGKPVTGGREKQAGIDAIYKDERHKICYFFFFTGIYRQKHDELERWRKVHPDGRRCGEGFLFIPVGVGWGKVCGRAEKVASMILAKMNICFALVAST